MEHKNGKCSETSVVSKLCESESKPQVWGFVLWKTKHSKVNTLTAHIILQI